MICPICHQDHEPALTPLEAEIERLRAEQTHPKVEEIMALIETFAENREADFVDQRERAIRAEERLAKVHLACAAYPITCPDCGYEWRAGLLKLAALAAAQPEEKP